MKTDRLESAGTYYASPERTDKIHLQKEFDQINNNPVMDTLLKSVGGLLAILDQNRQILSVNRSLADVLHIEDIEEVLGLRPGEALNCRFADCEPGGCGTSQFCSSCGAAVAIVTSLGTERTVERNCYLQLGEGKSAVNLAFQVRAHPVKSGGSTYVLLFMQDITRQEQRASLERTFFHDINNLLQGLSSASDMLHSESGEDKLVEIVSHASRLLVKEVEIQRCLLKDDPLACHIYRQEVRIADLLEEVKSLFSRNPLSKNRHLLISLDNPFFSFHTDPSLMIRILINMITNGLEASAENEAVTLWTEQKKDRIGFYVHNRQCIPEEQTLRIFHRNYTTKEGQGRGLGTYSMKLLGEKVLGGEVDFSTSPGGGTVFSLTLPLS